MLLASAQALKPARSTYVRPNLGAAIFAKAAVPTWWVPVAPRTARDAERVRSPAGIGQVEVREERSVRVRVLDLDTDVDRVELDIRD